VGTIRRAAVTGLFAAWLAPLTASADNPSSGRNAGGDLQLERPAEPVQADRPAEPVQTERPAEPVQTERPAEPAKAERPAEPAKEERPAEPVVEAQQDPASAEAGRKG
jgi:outer membrane biosynthesis protein TonB